MESAVVLAGRKGFSLGSLYEVETDFEKVFPILSSTRCPQTIRSKFVENLPRSSDVVSMQWNYRKS